MPVSNGTTDTSYNIASLQGSQRPIDKISFASAIEKIGREDTPLLSKIKTGEKPKNNRHHWGFKKIAEGERKAVAAVSGFDGGTKPTTQRLNNATEIFKKEDWFSRSAEDTETYSNEKEGEKWLDMAIAQKKSKELAILGVDRKVITDNGSGGYTYSELDADPVIASKLSLIAKPHFRSGDGTNPEDASQMAGIFHYIANTGLTQDLIESGSYRGLTDFTNGELGNLKTYDSAGDWTGNSVSIDRKHISSMIRRLTDYGVNPANGAFDLYAGGDLIEAIADMFGDKRRFDMKDKEIGYMVDVVSTQFGKVRLHYHRDFNDENGLGDMILMGNFNYLEKNYLTPDEKSFPSTDKTAKLLRIYADMTMSVRNAYAFSASCGLKA